MPATLIRSTLLVALGVLLGAVAGSALAGASWIVFGLLPVPLLAFAAWRMGVADEARREDARAAAVRAATERERERIYRNLHDDLGAHLLNMVYQAPDPETEERARLALQVLRDDLAATVDKQLTLIEVIESVRGEAESRLATRDVSVSWTLGSELEDAPVRVDNVVAVSRIFREAISNIVRHANARRVAIEVDMPEDAIRITITDDGDGIPEDYTPGRGLTSMAARARQLGGSLDVCADEAGGTRVELRLAR